MIQKLYMIALLVSLGVMGSTALAGDVLDRVVATVNGHVILQSDWEDAVRCEAFIAGRSADQFTGEDRKAALDRLIDQELLREQIRAADFQQATDEEIASRIQQIRKQYADAGPELGWQALLTRYGLTESGLKERVTMQLNLTRLVDARLRPTVNIDAKSIESYYNQELLPQLRQTGAKEVALTEVTPKIKELLTEQKVNELLTAWLQSLRAGSEIRTMFGAQAPGDEAR